LVKDSAAFAAAIAAFGTATKAKLSSAAASGSPEDQSGTRKRLSPTPNELAFPMEVVH